MTLHYYSPDMYYYDKCVQTDAFRLKKESLSWVLRGILVAFML